MNPLDEKIRNSFPDESVYKIPKRYSVFSGKSLPSFIKDWLIRKFTDEDGELDSYGLLRFLEEHIPHKNSDIKNRIRTHGEQVTILTRFIVETDIQKNVLRFSIPDLGIKTNEGKIPDRLAKKYNELRDGEMWGVISLIYIPPEGKEKGCIELTDFKPFKPYEVDIEYFKNARKEFSLEEWIDVLIRSMEYNPEGFANLTQKILFISRLLIFVEPNLNIIELAPKGTGKSYIFGNISKYGWLISGGTVTRAKLLYDISKNSMGIITHYDFVSMDEIETIKFADENELQGALKNYLESGVFTVAKVRGTSSAGLMLLGNIPLSSANQPIHNKYFSGLPLFFRSSALMDRFHGFIEGWKLQRVNENLKVRGYTLNVEYFSEILHMLREIPNYSYIIGELLNIPTNADTRDTTAIKKLSSAYLKIFFPHVEKPEDISKHDFNDFCLKPALEKRAIIRKQLALIDSEFHEDLPDINVRDR
ncbi:BREX system Lon protease-like protein BrxL [Desulfonema magnum]|uniref:ATP-dependent Lon protease domain-containing n=1 Tax=Desulfonema magnum TaxID=45655 RepID=A0A975BPX4_9BACT|nr:BREX system Lon protease-like protein BrxL [Desulfonema magnum]QTA89689.1 ATP-dependent Lon protease domain-containing [Desulfonema magnum]